MKKKCHYLYSLTHHPYGSIFKLWLLETCYCLDPSFQSKFSNQEYSRTDQDSSHNHWIASSRKLLVIQATHFTADLDSLQRKQTFSNSSSLLSLQPFIDDSDILRVGGRKPLSQTSNYQSRHPAILHGKHPLTHLMIRHEHQRLLHAGPTLLSASLSRHYHIVGGRKVVRSVARKCIICRRYTARPKPQMLPIERITPGSVLTMLVLWWSNMDTFVNPQ